MAAGQVFLGGTLSSGWSLQGAAGLFDLRGAERTKYLLASNGHRDYRIGVASVQLTRALHHEWFGMLRLGTDVLRNFRSDTLDASHPGVAAYREARTGLVVMTALGGRTRMGESGSWEISHTFAHIEKLAVNAPFSRLVGPHPHERCSSASLVAAAAGAYPRSAPAAARTCAPCVCGLTRTAPALLRPVVQPRIARPAEPNF